MILATGMKQALTVGEPVMTMPGGGAGGAGVVQVDTVDTGNPGIKLLFRL